ncbi:hypothetical protein ABK040_000704 [Willaertia magna]
MSASHIQNFKTFDAFADSNEQEHFSKSTTEQIVHIRIQKRNGRKSITIVEGLPKNFKFKKLLSTIKHKYCCNGTLINDEQLGTVLQFSGDKRKAVSEFLLEEGIVTKDTLKIHGF